jgi:hypothetical protein
MKKVALLSAACGLASALAFGGTPTIDGTFDGVLVWGIPVATNSNPGFSGAGATAIALYVTDDANYVYFGAQVTGLAGWMSYGFAIDARTGGANVQEPWQRQINFNFSVGGGFDAPEFVIRGNANNSWCERREWNGSSWTGGGTNIIPAGDASANTTTGFIEARIAKSTLNMRTSKQGRVEFYLSGDNNSHGLFTSVPYDTPCNEWNPSTPQSLTNPAAPLNLPVSLSAFTIE